MDRYTALAIILLAGLPVLARLWVPVGRDDDKMKQSEFDLEANSEKQEWDAWLILIILLTLAFAAGLAYVVYRWFCYFPE